MFMRGTVAKRIFILFIIAAFIPALALAILSYSQVRSVLLEQAQDRLSHIARNYSLNLYERMLLADNSIKHIASNKYYGSYPTTDNMEFFNQIFDRLTIAGPSVPSVSILGSKIPWPEITKDQSDFLSMGNSILYVKTNTNSKPDIFLIKLINANKPDNYALVGELNPSKLWGHKDNFPYMTNFCVLNNKDSLLFCSRPHSRLRSTRCAKKVVTGCRSSLIRWLRSSYLWKGPSLSL